MAFRNLKSSTTPLTVSSEDDLSGVTEIIKSLCVFELGGKEWTTWTADTITDVDYTLHGSYIRIRSVKFAVPVEGSEGAAITYSKTVEVNKNIRIGVSE